MILRIISDWMFRMWYRYVQYMDKNAEVLFMNYGYNNPNKAFDVDPAYKKNKFSVQLYHLLASDVNIKDKVILEVGSGRGGGLSYIAKNFAPAKALGVDLNKSAADFCNNYYNMKGLSFEHGDAQDLSFLEDHSFDVILNVESSHRYPRIHHFLKEVYRLLRPSGYFLYTDFRPDQKFPELKQQLAESGLVILKEDVITEYVVSALEEDDQRKRLLVKKLAPIGVRPIALNFAATKGTKTYNKFVRNTMGYYHFLLQKPEQQQ